MRNSVINSLLSFFLFLFLTQTTVSQVVISAPALGFSQACASPSFNTYNVSFSFSPEASLIATNQFILELSDDSGSFSNATAIYTSAQGSITTSPANLTFTLPTTIAGDSYKLRIKSTAPAATSTGSVSFAAYYKFQDEPFSINNLISTGVYCSGGSYLLTIDDPGDDLNNSPLQYPSLTYNWYKETSPTTSVFVVSGATLSVNEPGVYFAETNYGACSSNSYSNRVTVSESTSGAGITSSITSSLGNPYCLSQGATTLSTVNGNSFQWYKNGEVISGATNQSYETNEAGAYSVDIDFGGCNGSASINLDNTGFTSSIDVLDVNEIVENETLIATVTTTAIDPEFSWYLKDVLIPGAISNSYEITEVGEYKVVISQNSGCIASSELLFTVTTQFPNVENIPNLISPNADGVNDTWVIPKEYVSDTNTEVIIISSQGEIVLKTNNYQNNWPVDQLDFNEINPVYYYIITPENNQIRKGSITVIK